METKLDKKIKKFIKKKLWADNEIYNYLNKQLGFDLHGQDVTLALYLILRKMEKEK